MLFLFLFLHKFKNVINIDDPAGAYMESVSKGEIITTGIDSDADLKAENIDITAHGVTFTLDYEGKQYPVELNIPGKFSIYNALGSIGACLFMGIDMDTIIAGLKDIKGVRGRFQSVKGKTDLSVKRSEFKIQAILYISLPIILICCFNIEMVTILWLFLTM